MKQPSKPTRAQKQIMSENGLRPESWMVVYESRDTLEVISKRSKQRRVLNKKKQDWRIQMITEMLSIKGTKTL